MKPLSALALLAGLVLSAPLGAQVQREPYGEITGPVTALSGDEISIGGTRIRLYGIDAPEPGQTCFTRSGRAYDCGARAQAALEALVAGREVACGRFGDTVDGRAAATCAADGHDIGLALIAQGWAFSLRGLSDRYESAESRAQAARRGLWAGRAQRPWQHRQQQAEGGGR